MARSERLICAARDLDDGGAGVRFEVRVAGRREPAFVVRFGGRVFGYLNRCAHVPTELDWIDGQFFDADRRWLMCATHGAIYDPATGRCAGGPCRGGGLVPVEVVEQDDAVFVLERSED
ncbi:MAG: Rieske 2Fe-2S domain-containing protein [Rhodocyclaceae bacterium]|nr:Rieske 2Fe-2S domain-containing protein [Rhodocyclaceae bacterium]